MELEPRAGNELHELRLVLQMVRAKRLDVCLSVNVVNVDLIDILWPREAVRKRNLVAS